jgi:multidrug efflux system membrane fusion protein
MELGKLKQFRSWMISAGIAVLVSVWLASGQIGSGAPEDDQAPASVIVGPAAPQQSSVRVRTQSAEAIMRTIVVNGETAPARVVDIAAETDGRVEYVGVDRGTNVDRNAVIVRLDERDRRARLAQAEATVRQREVEYQGRLKLKGESYVSEAQLQEAVAQLEAAKAELKRAQLDLDYMTIRSPFAGALQERHVEVGDFVKAGDPVARFVDNRKIIVTANVSEFDAGYVQTGQAAQARLATGETVHGTIRYVAPVADESTRTYTVELEVDNGTGSLRAGGTAELQVPAERVLAHRISPSLLTLDDAGNIGVKIVNDEGEVEFVVADVALSTNEGVWIAGLPDLATIITVGQGFVVPGTTVDAIPEGDIETAVAITAEHED